MRWSKPSFQTLPISTSTRPRSSPALFRIEGASALERNPLFDQPGGEA
jgi:hypothetical protein